MDAAIGDPATAPTTLYRQRIGLLAAQATAAAASSLASRGTTGTEPAVVEGQISSSLPSRQVAAYVFEFLGDRHPGFVPRELVAEMNGVWVAKENSLLSNLPFSDSRGSESDRRRQPVQGNAVAARKTVPYYLPCCTTCGGVLHPGDGISTSSIRVVRCPPISRAKRRRECRARSQAKKRAMPTAAGNAPTVSNEPLPIVSTPSSMNAAEYRNCVELVCRVCQSKCYVPGVARNAGRKPQQPKSAPDPARPTKADPSTQRSRPAAPQRAMASSTTTTTTATEPTDMNRKRTSDLLEPPSNLGSDDFISLSDPTKDSLPQRVQSSKRSKKKQGKNGPQKDLMKFLSSLND